VIIATSSENSYDPDREGMQVAGVSVLGDASLVQDPRGEKHSGTKHTVGYERGVQWIVYS